MEPGNSGNRPMSPRAIIGIGVIAFIVIVVLIVIMWAGEFFHKNPYGNEIRISNFDEYFKDVPKEDEDKIFYNLYNIVKQNSSANEDVGSFVGVVRENSVEKEFDSEADIYYGSFLVDLEAARQSYRVQFEWSVTKSKYIVGTSVTITCPKSNELIFGDFNCIDIFIEQEKLSNELDNEFPIMRNLPIDIAYYDKKTGRYISYRIVGELSDDLKNYKIVITDRSGENYDLAMNRIREQRCGDARCDPNDYKIEYMDVSQDGDTEVRF